MKARRGEFVWYCVNCKTKQRVAVHRYQTSFKCECNHVFTPKTFTKKIEQSHGKSKEDDL